MVALASGYCFSTKTSPGYLIRRASQLMVPLAERYFEGQDLSLSQWISLKMIRDGIAPTIGELARYLGHSSGATTRLVDQLEERGLITRNRSNEDRRVVALEITPAGLEATRNMGVRMMEMWDQLFADFEQDEAEMLIVLLSKLVARLEAESAEDVR
jgi:DNA-binding MarR family transcriptional regulator